MKTRDKFCDVAILFGLGILLGSVWECGADDSDQRHWSFQKVRPVSVPQVQDRQLAGSAIDAFILVELEKRQLRPSPKADKATLLRRITFDLTGVPPTPAEVDAFLEDSSPTAFAEVVERLLASPRYGERWGRHWLDVVRYADARDLIQLPAESDFREAWRFRDWVVASFNRDLPYDRFVKQQVAGDLMQPTDRTQIDADALVATGLLAIADFVPGDVDKEQMIADYVNDQIDVVGRAFLGMTVACARCHDHKFDPISTEDYYALAGIFFSTRLIPSPVKGNTPLVRVPLVSPVEFAAYEEGQKPDALRISELSRQINTFADGQYRSILSRKVASDTKSYLLAARECLQSAAVRDQAVIDGLASKHGLNGSTLARWIEFFEQKPDRPSLQTLKSATDVDQATRDANGIADRLNELLASRQKQAESDANQKTLEESLLLRIHADDVRLTTSESNRISFIPNRGPFPENASSVADVMSPVKVPAKIGDHSISAIHFSGNELLQVPRSVPSVGSLMIVFRPDPAGGSGQRLIGWEDASVGQHGLGIMIDSNRSLHVIARRQGANGDVVVKAAEESSISSDFQIVCVTWGTDGVSVFRNGQRVGHNKAIDSISSDPAVKSLRVGGPGSGSSSRFQGDLAELRVYNVPVDESVRKRVEAELTDRWILGKDVPKTADPIEEMLDDLLSGLSPFQVPATERDQSLSEESRSRLSELQTELETLKKKPKSNIPFAVVVQEGGPAETPHAGFNDAHVYLRGNHLNRGKQVPRGFPSAISSSERPEIREGSGRRELASWLASPANPLTARVMVNRIWQHHFGVGLVSTSANFGAAGEPPSHPELLDFLAARLIESDWSIKSLHRMIVLSNTYQQSSIANPQGLSIDPENRFLWRSNRRRLEAEAIRDGLLSIADKLDSTIGGLGFQDVTLPRRSLYLMSVRTGAKTAEFAPLFDSPDCSAIIERRTESIVAPQALFFMNDPFILQLSKDVSDRLRGETKSGPTTDRIDLLYKLTFGRNPTEAERDVGFRLVGAGEQPDAWAGYCRLIVSTNEFLFVD